MTPAEIARAMGEYIAANGFNEQWRVGRRGCGCFAHALGAVTGKGDKAGHLYAWTEEPMPTIRSVIGADTFHASSLLRAGWTGPKVTADAAAACDIAADLLS